MFLAVGSRCKCLFTALIYCVIYGAGLVQFESGNFDDTERVLGELKAKSVDSIAHNFAPNLISPIADKGFRSEPLMSQVLAHLFISGRHSSRMVGMEAEFNVFISL